MPLGIYNSNAFRNASGVQVVPNANVEVRRESDGGLAVIYSTRDADSNTEIDQVGYPATTGFKAEADGYFEFYAEGIADGYQVRVYSDDLTLDKTVRYQPTGTARERDASDYGAGLMNAADAAAALALLGVKSEATVSAERVGVVAMWAGPATPSNALDCDGVAYSRTTYAALFAKLVKSATATITIASPGVVTWTAHGLKNHMPVKFTTTGSLPTGLTAGRNYWVVNAATDTFQLAATPGGTAINTSGTQSGVHTAICAPHGDGDGSTTFNVPDMTDAVPVGMGAATISESFAPADVTTGTDSIALPANVAKWQTGMAVVFTTTGTAPSPLVNSTTYYVIRTGTGSIKLATSLANAQNGTAIDITTQGTGTHTITHSRVTRGLGETMGEDAHAQAVSEAVPQNSNFIVANFGGNGSLAITLNAGSAQNLYQGTVTATGGNNAANIMQPGKGMRYIIYHA